MRVVIGEDSALFRAGLRALLTEVGHDVVADAGDAPSALAAVLDHRPDVAVLDIRMPRTTPTTAPGSRSRSERPCPTQPCCCSPSTSSPGSRSTSSPADGSATSSGPRPGRRRVHRRPRPRRRRGSALDPEVVARLMVGNRSALQGSPHAREVLGLMAEGLSNAGVAHRLVLTERTVETHVSRILTKLGLAESANTDHRRVLAVLRYLESHRSG